MGNGEQDMAQSHREARWCVIRGGVLARL